MAMLFNIANLRSLLELSGKSGYRFVAPVNLNGKTMFSQTSSADEIVLDSVITDLSAKDHYFSRCEKIAACTRHKDGSLELSDPMEGDVAVKTVIFGARPCDAAAIPVIEKVFRWDFDDHFVLEKLASTVVISIACKENLPSCFCTSVDCGPDSERGADLLLYPTSEEGQYIAKVLTDKGRDFAELASGAFSQGDVQVSPKVVELKAEMEEKFDPARVREWTSRNFESEFWKTAAPTCLGCGSCAYTCPTCHCFDIVDEGNVEKSIRLKSWDACQFALFTLHTSGHNPRETSKDRYRQRINHKFNYYHEKFSEFLCTGCGRCFLNCPVGIDMSEILTRIDKLASK